MPPRDAAHPTPSSFHDVIARVATFIGARGRATRFRWIVLICREDSAEVAEVTMAFMTENTIRDSFEAARERFLPYVPREGTGGGGG